MNKSEVYRMFGRYVQRLALAGKKLVTVRELWELLKRGELTRNEIGWWLKRQGFIRVERKVRDKQRSRGWLLNEEALGVVRKKNRIGVRCGYSCGWTGYYDMLPDEEFSPGSSSIIQRVGDPSVWKCMYCPKHDRMDVRAHYNLKATEDIKKQKEKVAFTAREITASGGLARDTGEGSFSGPGMLGVPDNLKGRY